MKIAFYFPNQAAPTAQWTPDTSPRLPIKAAADYPAQVVGETAAGTVHVQDQGGLRERFELSFERLRRDERDSAFSFYQTVRKSFNAFDYVDTSGTVHTVRWSNGFDFEETVHDRFTGTVVLQKE